MERIHHEEKLARAHQAVADEKKARLEQAKKDRAELDKELAKLKAYQRQMAKGKQVAFSEEEGHVTPQPSGSRIQPPAGEREPASRPATAIQVAPPSKSFSLFDGKAVA